MVDEPEWQRGMVDFHLQNEASLYYLYLADTVQYVVKQRAYAEHLVFTPSWQFDSRGEGIYAEMHTRNGWWRIQVECPAGTC